MPDVFLPCINKDDDDDDDDDDLYPRGGGVLAIMAYTGRLRAKGVPFSGTCV